MNEATTDETRAALAGRDSSELLSCCGKQPDKQVVGIGGDEYIEIECQCCNKMVRAEGHKTAAQAWNCIAR